MDASDKKHLPVSRILQIISAILIGLSGIPYLLTLSNISPVIHYAIEEGKNVGLQLYLFLCLAGLLSGLGFIILIISLFIREKTIQIEPSN